MPVSLTGPKIEKYIAIDCLYIMPHQLFVIGLVGFCLKISSMMFRNIADYTIGYS